MTSVRVKPFAITNLDIYGVLSLDYPLCSCGGNMTYYSDEAEVVASKLPAVVSGGIIKCNSCEHHFHDCFLDLRLDEKDGIYTNAFLLG